MIVPLKTSGVTRVVLQKPGHILFLSACGVWVAAWQRPVFSRIAL